MQRFFIGLIIDTNTREIPANEVRERLNDVAIANLDRLFTGKVIVQNAQEGFLFVLGGMLPNGATILAIKPNPQGSGHIVLADRGFGVSPFVTWVADKNGNCDHGHYAATLPDALAEFHKRGNRISDICHGDPLIQAIAGNE